MKLSRLASSLIKSGLKHVGVCQVVSKKKWRKLPKAEGVLQLKVLMNVFMRPIENRPLTFFSGSTLV